MSYAKRLIHPLVIVAPDITGDAEDPDDLDEYGQPTASTPSQRQVRGLVQPKTAREMSLISQGGVEVSDHTIFLPSMSLKAQGYITDDPPAGRRFEITGVRSFEYGGSPHLEVDARLVGSTEGPTVGS